MYQEGYYNNGYGAAGMQGDMYNTPMMDNPGFNYGGVQDMNAYAPYDNVQSGEQGFDQPVQGAGGLSRGLSTRSGSNVPRTKSEGGRSNSMSRNASNAGQGTGLARSGSIYRGASQRDTQASLSMRGGVSTRSMEQVQETYGDMARRSNVSTIHGLKVVKSYRGELSDGADMGKPRRVITRQNGNGHSTGYGGIRFRRDVALMRGEDWGAIGRRERTQPQQSRDIPEPQMEMPMMPIIEEDLGPRQIPQVYAREETRTYSNLSTMF